MKPGTRENRKVVLRRRLLLAGWLLGAGMILARSAELQVVEGPEWRGTADSQHRKTLDVPASRGAILDRNGVPLAESRERFKVMALTRGLQQPLIGFSVRDLSDRL